MARRDHRAQARSLDRPFLASQAAFKVLEAGGNAIDAGVAAGLVLGVVHSDQVNVAGVAPMIIWMAQREELVTIDGVGVWPRSFPRYLTIAGFGVSRGRFPGATLDTGDAHPPTTANLVTTARARPRNDNRVARDIAGTDRNRVAAFVDHAHQ